MGNRFRALKDSAVKVAKFKQGKYMNTLDPANPAPEAGAPFTTLQYDTLKQGICAGLTAQWLKEKMYGSNGLLSRTPKNFVRTPTRAKMAEVMGEGARDQISGSDIDGMLARHRITTSAFPEMKNDKDAGDPTFKAYISLDRNFGTVCSELEKGKGAVLRLSVLDTSKPLTKESSSRHAAALYKSRAGRVYFFDSNAGVYQVKDPERFIGSWIRAYAASQKTLSMRDPNDGYFACERA
jgi:hypothetical protein